MGEEDDKTLDKLKKLVLDYSYPEKVYENMLHEINDLLQWAINKYIRRGLSPEEVKELLGESHIKIGEVNDNVFDWLYPCEPPMDKHEPLAMNENWYWDLKFVDQKLSVIEKKRWRLII